MHEFAYTIDSSQLESKYKHLHHADALRFLERARLDYLTAIGFPNDAFIAQNLFLVITDIAVKYKRELVAGDIFVRCTSGEISSRLVIIEQEILNAQRKIAVAATVRSCFMAGDTRRVILPPSAFIAAVENQK